MINFKALLILPIFALMIGCGGSEQSQQDAAAKPESVAETMADTTSSVTADSIINELDKTSQELQSASEEAQKAVEELVEDK